MRASYNTSLEIATILLRWRLNYDIKIQLKKVGGCTLMYFKAEINFKERSLNKLHKRFFLIKHEKERS